MNEPDPKIIKSPLCQKVTSDGITVDVEIYRLETSEGWSLEIVDAEWNSTVWDGLFATDQAALDEFLIGLRKEGLAKLLQSDNGSPTMH